jgi:hypothetical protein
MAGQFQLRSGTTAQHGSFTGAEGELTYDTEKKQLRVHDGIAVGGKVVDDTTRNVTSQVSNATETVAGKAKIATTAIAQAGVNDTDFITALKLRGVLFGVGQTYTDITSSIVFGSVYTNTSNKPELISVQNKPQSSSQGSNMTIEVDNVVVSAMSGNSGYFVTSTICAVIPVGASYKIGGVNLGIQRVVRLS